MCGRTSLFADRATIERTFDVAFAPGHDYRPRYNVAPTETLSVVTNDAPETVDGAHWGFTAEEDVLINARSGTVAETGAFREAWYERPCLVLSSGFYEWGDERGGRRPYRIYRDGRSVFAMAGLWSSTDDGRTVTILTTGADATVAPIHDRMPVLLDEAAADEWLRADAERRAALCRSGGVDDLTADPISSRVNDPTTDDPGVIEPDDTEQSGLDEF
ncbi:SOS response-associated peptidase [Halobacteriales archaeon SW_7_68_16]|nr:MAG: SOS response-associated peptidase [Halobacteriales archaeon SW_7_68_16]